MNMETVFLACFAFGALFTLVSVLFGALGHLPGAHAGHAGHLPHAAHAAGHGGQAASDGNGAPPSHVSAGAWLMPLLNASSVLAFLTWFGAAGFLLTHFTAWPLLVALVVAVVSGLLAATLIALFLRKLMAGERVMDPADYELEGTLARVTVTIPAGGVGEIVFSKAGTRRSEAARSETGDAIARETEVVILNHEHGVASVQPWRQLLGREDDSPARSAAEDSQPSAALPSPRT